MFENIFRDKCKIEEIEPLNKKNMIGRDLASMYIDKIILNIKKTEEQIGIVINSIDEPDNNIYNVLLPNIRKTLNELQNITCDIDNGMFFKIEKDSNECYTYIFQSSSIGRLKKYIHASNNVIIFLEDREFSESNRHNQSLYIRLDIQRTWFNAFVKSFELKCGYNINMWVSSVVEIKTKSDLNKVIGNSFNLIPVPIKIYKLCENATEK